MTTTTKKEIYPRFTIEWPIQPSLVYWKNHPLFCGVVEKYLNNQPMDELDIEFMFNYLSLFKKANYKGPKLLEKPFERTRKGIHKAIMYLIELGIDPL